MGGLLSTTPRRERQFHASYRQGARELANMPAGRRGPGDDYTFVRYCCSVQDLLAASRSVVDDFEEVRRHFDAKTQMNQAIMKMRHSLQRLREVYEQFFRESSWAIDPKVDERKKFGAEAYFKIQLIKDKLGEIDIDSDEQMLSEIQKDIRDQVRLAVRISCNFDANKKDRIMPDQQRAVHLEAPVAIAEDTSL